MASQALVSMLACALGSNGMAGNAVGWLTADVVLDSVARYANNDQQRGYEQPNAGQPFSHSFGYCFDHCRGAGYWGRVVLKESLRVDWAPEVYVRLVLGHTVFLARLPSTTDFNHETYGRTTCAHRSLYGRREKSPDSRH